MLSLFDSLINLFALAAMKNSHNNQQYRQEQRKTAEQKAIFAQD